MREVEIKKGDAVVGSAVLRTREDMRVRHRRLVETAGIAAARVIARLPQGLTTDTEMVENLNLDERDAEALLRVRDATLVATLVSWSLDEPLPTLETVGDMDPDVYDSLVASLQEDAVGATDFGPDGAGDPESPTRPSGHSDEPSGEAVTVSQPALLSSTGSTVTGASTT